MTPGQLAKAEAVNAQREEEYRQLRQTGVLPPLPPDDCDDVAPAPATAPAASAGSEAGDYSAVAATGEEEDGGTKGPPIGATNTADRSADSSAAAGGVGGGGLDGMGSTSRDARLQDIQYTLKDDIESSRP